MKRIIKGHSPADFEAWKSGDGKGASYKGNSDIVRGYCIEPLVREQKGICCYTGISITKDSAHIEHLNPQNLSNREGTDDDLNYANMLAAYPLTGGCTYGAMKKGPNTIKVTPLDIDCETRFRFSLEGNIRPAAEPSRSGGNDDSEEDARTKYSDAKDTITTLGLDDPTLTQKRKNAIEEAIFSKRNVGSKGYISSAELLQRKLQMQGVNREGNYYAFCFAIEQACDLALAIKEKRAREKQYRTKSLRRNRA